MKAKLVKESISNDKAYPKMSVEEFIDYLSSIMSEYPDENYDMIFDRLVNDEYSDDDKLGAILFKDGVPPLLIGKLMEVREYFWDFRYAQHINI